MNGTANALDKYSKHRSLKLLQTNSLTSNFIIISHSDNILFQIM